MGNICGGPKDQKATYLDQSGLYQQSMMQISMAESQMMETEASKLKINHDKLQDLQCNLVDISLALTKMFQNLSQVKDKDLTIVIGG